MQRSWLIRAGGWLWAVTGRGPRAARRVVRSPERLQQPSGEAKCFASSHFFHEPSVDRVEAVEGDSEFASKEFITLNKEKGIRVDTSVAADNHFTTGNKLGIIDRFTRTLKENLKKYRESIGKIGNLPNIIQSIINMYNDSPHRGIKGKTPNQVWNDTNEQNIQNMKDTINNDRLFNKLTLGIGDTVRVLENKNKFDKGSAQFSKELYEVHDRIGYSFKVKDSDGNVKRRRYKPHELLQVVNMTDVINTDRVKREE